MVKLAFLLICIFPTVAGAAEVQKWKDREGTVNYGDSAPTGAKVESITIQPNVIETDPVQLDEGPNRVQQATPQSVTVSGPAMDNRAAFEEYVRTCERNRGVDCEDEARRMLTGPGIGAPGRAVPPPGPIGGLPPSVPGTTTGPGTTSTPGATSSAGASPGATTTPSATVSPNALPGASSTPGTSSSPGTTSTAAGSSASTPGTSAATTPGSTGTPASTGTSSATGTTSGAATGGNSATGTSVSGAGGAAEAVPAQRPSPAARAR
jgi:hypothetical protein